MASRDPQDNPLTEEQFKLYSDMILTRGSLCGRILAIEFLALGLVAVDQFAGEVLRLRRRAAVAANEDPAAAEQRRRHRFDGPRQIGRQRIAGRGLDGKAVVEQPDDALR